MTLQQILFIVISIAVLASAVFVVTTRNLFHAALMLILSFFGVAGFYVLLEAGFFAVAQVLVYIGAISILFIFAVMLTRGMMGMPRNNSQATGAALVAAAIFIGMAFVLGPLAATVQAPFLPNSTPRDIGGIPWAYSTLPVIPDQYIFDLGRALTEPARFALPFELASVLILLAMVGSIWIARERRPAEVQAERLEAANAAAEDAKLEEALERGSVSSAPEAAVAVAAADHH